MWPTPTRGFALYLCFVISLAIVSARSQTAWINASDGLWRDSLNWSAGVPDAVTEMILIDNSGTKTVLIDAFTPAMNLHIRRLVVEAPESFTNTLLLQNLASPFFADGTLRVNPGGRVVIDNSTFEIDGADGASLNLSGGEIELKGGALVFSNAARGRIGFGSSGRLEVVSGELHASEDLLVGALGGGDGRLVIKGGQVNVGVNLVVADDVDSTGIISLEGGTLTATNNTVTTRIGDDGSGEVSVSGGTLLVDDLSIGRSAGSVGRLTIAGGTVVSKDISLGRFPDATGELVLISGELSLADDSLLIGREGIGTAQISGGSLAARDITIATNSTATGTLLVSGGLVNVDSHVVVGGLGATGIVNVAGGTITVTNATAGGTFVVANGNLSINSGTLQVDRLFLTNQAGTMTFSGGTLKTVGTRIDNGRRFVVGDGTRAAILHLEGGTHTFVGGLEISANASVTGCGTIIGEIINHGTIATNCGEAPVLTAPRISAAGISFELLTRTGANYVVEYKESLSAAQWTTLQTYQGTGTAITVTDPLAAAVRFYRVRVE